MTRLDRPSALLAWLAGLSVLSWPIALSRAALAFAYHDRQDDVVKATAIIRPFACAGTVIFVVWLCLRRRTRAKDFAMAGGIGGLLLGPALFTVVELLHSSYLTPMETLKLGLGAFAAGGFWAIPIAAPVGAGFGLPRLHCVVLREAAATVDQALGHWRASRGLSDDVDPLTAQLASLLKSYAVGGSRVGLDLSGAPRFRRVRRRRGLRRSLN
ncbi:MAG: hypothetical protein ACLP1X_20490 [Polyangiaceae bacterium]